MLTFEEHQNSSGNLDEFKWPDGEEETRDAHRITFQDGIVPARRGFRTVPGFVRVVSRLTPRSQRRKVVAGTLTAATRRKLPDSREVARIELRSLSHRQRREHQRRPDSNRANERILHDHLFLTEIVCRSTFPA